jgi:8-oxo-dGTP pyrophosphatase MutT (NUDIX family)
MGMWGIPQGFLEHGETTREAAIREVWEETGAQLQDLLLRLRAVYNLPGSVQLVYEARVSGAILERQIAESTHESSEVALFSNDSIPHEELCFPTVRWALDHCLASGNTKVFPVQQRTKYYNADQDIWSVFEDERDDVHNS